MIIMMHAPTTAQIARVLDKIRQMGLEPHCITSCDKTIITTVGHGDEANCEQFERLPGVARVVPVLSPFQLVSREFRAEDSLVAVGSVCFGGPVTPVIGRTVRRGKL